MVEMSDGSMDGGKLPVEGGVVRLGWRELPTEEGKRLFGAVEDLLEDGTDGNVTNVGGEDEGKTRHQEFEVGGVREGSFCVVEDCSLQRAPVEGLGFPGQGGVETSHSVGNVRQGSMVVVDHANELLQDLHSPAGKGRPWKRYDGPRNRPPWFRRYICRAGGQDQWSGDVQGPGEGDASSLQERRRRQGYHRRR